MFSQVKGSFIKPWDIARLYVLWGSLDYPGCLRPGVSRTDLLKPLINPIYLNLQSIDLTNIIPGSRPLVKPFSL